MKNHIDITFDLETVATTANAAVMQVAAVAWVRDAEKDPFTLVLDGKPVDKNIFFNKHVDLRTCVTDGFDFDTATVQWWSRQNDVAKKAVCADVAEPVCEAFVHFMEWMNIVKIETRAESICLWCQGMDFDGAILRNICKKYDLRLPFRYQQFRDCRTMILEAAVMYSDACSGPHIDLCKPQDILADDRKAYDLYPSLPDEYTNSSEAHDALYDAVRSSWNTWLAMRWTRGVMN